ncbi:1-aminocyclopropane-1-carboxylate deaminase/D-cysteine desulfhydrase [Roseivirga thermotolerans]|uniref:1-aminocyclopropane-1-carboxylate deaminase n=1 Tax=Roseivirga thermotolerans TaxID=1758176 RepID=A0ABQ3I1M9_9BACT|nr:pyridoxal-phosphate dependent enzyme [Roseivirga thermotolerans]GHE54629.1 1-aminocyclopropane-1-carboxylate deaminase [Roseivirga thermotolerans]
MNFSVINERLPIEKLLHPIAEENQVDLRILRLDKTHPKISGNKWFKLKHNLMQANKEGFTSLLTFGGAYSNHIYAVAAAANLFGFRSIGLIRGEAQQSLNPTLQFAQEQGMQLRYVDRTSYRAKDTPEFLERLRDEFGYFYLIPEGGTNTQAIRGSQEIAAHIPESFDYYCLPVGTGGTMAGLITGLQNRGQVVGFSALKGSFLAGEVNRLLEYCGAKHHHNWFVQNNYHFGGYAKVKPELMQFIKTMEAEFDLLLDPVYTGKMLYGMLDMIHKGEIKKGSKVLAIHTGGLQGRAGFGL